MTVEEFEKGLGEDNFLETGRLSQAVGQRNSARKLVVDGASNESWP